MQQIESALLNDWHQKEQNAQRKLINTPGSAAKYLLQFPNNELTILSPGMIIFQGGLIRINRLTN